MQLAMDMLKLEQDHRLEESNKRIFSTENRESFHSIPMHTIEPTRHRRCSSNISRSSLSSSTTVIPPTTADRSIHYSVCPAITMHTKSDRMWMGKNTKFSEPIECVKRGYVWKDVNIVGAKKVASTSILPPSEIALLKSKLNELNINIVEALKASKEENILKVKDAVDIILKGAHEEEIAKKITLYLSNPIVCSGQEIGYISKDQIIKAFM